MHCRAAFAMTVRLKYRTLRGKIVETVLKEVFYENKVQNDLRGSSFNKLYFC